MKVEPQHYSLFTRLVRAEGFEPKCFRRGIPEWKDAEPDAAFLAGVFLEIKKVEALEAARAMASRYHRQIAQQASEPRAIAWVLKTPLALFALAFSDTRNPALTPLVAQIKDGFVGEAEIGGEDPDALMQSCIAKGLGFGMATQIVEGMERLAEDRIPAATTPEELETAVADLLAQEETAKAKLAELQALEA